MLGSGSGSSSYTLIESADYRIGSLSLTETGSARYAKMELANRPTTTRMNEQVQFANLTQEGSRAIEQFREDDLVLSRSEFDPVCDT